MRIDTDEEDKNGIDNDMNLTQGLVIKEHALCQRILNELLRTTIGNRRILAP